MRGQQTRPRTYLKVRRLEKGLSQTAVADAVGLSFVMLAFIEKGQGKCRNPSNRVIIAELLDAPIATLFDEDGWANMLPGEDRQLYTPSPLTRRQLDRVHTLTERGWSRRRIAADLDIKVYRVDQAKDQLGIRPNYRDVTLESYTGTTGSNPEVSGRGRGGRT